jgi:hypothetical protein
MIINKIRIVVLVFLVFIISSFILIKPLSSVEDGYPQAEISNGLVNAKLYLPDPDAGYYRSTRFDWSGAVYSLQYKGHEFYGEWFDRIDKDIINWIFKGPEIVSGPCSALAGPVDEFEIPLGWDEAPSGGTFIKLGVGVLRKTEGAYNRYYPYEVLNSGTWKVIAGKDSVRFTQELADPGSGYSYIYTKVVKLDRNKPVLKIKHSMRNTGNHTIKSSVYNHNFVVLDKQAPGPDFRFSVPFQIQPSRISDKNLADVKGNEIVYKKALSGQDEAVVLFTGFSNSVKDTEITIENKKAGAGMKISGDKPLTNEILWSIRSVLAIEPYISIDIQPGDEFKWENSIEYYTM